MQGGNCVGQLLWIWLRQGLTLLLRPAWDLPEDQIGLEFGNNISDSASQVLGFQSYTTMTGNRLVQSLKNSETLLKFKARRSFFLICLARSLPINGNERQTERYTHRNRNWGLGKTEIMEDRYLVSCTRWPLQIFPQHFISSAPGRPGWDGSSEQLCWNPALYPNKLEMCLFNQNGMCPGVPRSGMAKNKQGIHCHFECQIICLL